VERPESGSLEWESLLMVTGFSFVLGTSSSQRHEITLLIIPSNGRGGGDNAGGAPASGKKPISTLQQAVANFGVDPGSGVLTQQDYFEPFEYQSLNGGDRDFGSSGVALLDPTAFSGAGVSRIGVVGGKSGKVYVLNADNLGGFANGSLMEPIHYQFYNMLTKKQDLVAQMLVRDSIANRCCSTNLCQVIQTIVQPNSLFSGIGSYPLEGGYF